MFGFLKSWMTPYKNNLTLEEVGGIPDCTQFINGLKYSTDNAQLLAYYIRNKVYDSDGILLGLGIYFDGLYKTPKGRYFRYQYEKEGERLIVQRISPRDLDFASSFMSKSIYIKLVTPQEALNYEDA